MSSRGGEISSIIDSYKHLTLNYAPFCLIFGADLVIGIANELFADIVELDEGAIERLRCSDGQMAVEIEELKFDIRAVKCQGRLDRSYTLSEPITIELAQIEHDL